MSNYIIFANNLKLILKKKKISQLTLANALGVKPATVCRYCKGINQPDIDMIIKIASFLNVSLDQLFGLDIKSESLSDEEEYILDMYRNLSNKAKIIVKEHIEIIKKNS